jgi:ABC-type polysaccharide/polyol phosphate transport system ATPase subunit
MFLRLAFAISTSIEPEILIMDEMISAGDAQFIEEAKPRLREVVDKATLASHQIAVIQRIYNKVVWLGRGTIKEFRPTDRVVEAYKRIHGGAEVEPVGADEAGLLTDRTSLMSIAEGQPAL